MKTIIAILGIAMLILVACTAPVQKPVTQETITQPAMQTQEIVVETPTETDVIEIETATTEADDLSKELDTTTFDDMDKTLAEIDSMEFD